MDNRFATVLFAIGVLTVIAFTLATVALYLHEHAI